MHQGRYNDDYARRTMNPARALQPERWISFDGRNHSVTPRRGAYKILFFTTCSLKKKAKIWHLCVRFTCINTTFGAYETKTNCLFIIVKFSFVLQL
jgi:hypothetical protein